MIKEKNRTMLFIATGTLLLSLVVHFLHRFIGGFGGHEETMTHSWLHGLFVNFLMLLPVLAVIPAFFFNRLSGDHRWIPILNTF